MVVGERQVGGDHAAGGVAHPGLEGGLGAGAAGVDDQPAGLGLGVKARGRRRIAEDDLGEPLRPREGDLHGDFDRAVGPVVDVGGAGLADEVVDPEAGLVVHGGQVAQVRLRGDAQGVEGIRQAPVAVREGGALGHQAPLGERAALGRHPDALDAQDEAGPVDRKAVLVLLHQDVAVGGKRGARRRRLGGGGGLGSGDRSGGDREAEGEGGEQRALHRVGHSLSQESA
ncbi:hypothetical protein D3C86_1253960 [compost metagenome]